MTWSDAQAAFQLLTEERAGRTLRAARAAEDRVFAATSAGLQRG